jgi:hypothetical protein
MAPLVQRIGIDLELDFLVGQNTSTELQATDSPRIDHDRFGRARHPRVGLHLS